MANDINSVVLVGRLTRESELKYLNNGTAVARLSLAVNRMKKSGDQWEEEVSFIDVVIWGKTAESLNPYLTKGRQVAVLGELRQSRWEQDGQSRSKIEVSANSVQLIGGDRNSNAEAPRETDARSYPKNDAQHAPKKEPVQKGLYGGAPANGFDPQPRGASGFPGPEQFDDDIPF